jgi:transcriptional regulator with XRE-family HTH domain
MTEIAQYIEIDLEKKLRDDAAYRRKFFWAESSALIAKQLIRLRKRRELSQSQVAEKAGTKQPAISRAEKADYQNWSFSTIRNIADALDARVRVIIQPTEDILGEYASDAETIAPSVPTVNPIEVISIPAGTIDQRMYSSVVDEPTGDRLYQDVSSLDEMSELETRYVS